MKIIALFLSFLTIYACARNGETIRTEKYGSGEKYYISFNGNKNPSFCIDYSGTNFSRSEFRQFLSTSVRIFSFYSAGKVMPAEDTVFLTADDRIYPFFLEFGSSYLAEIKNELILYGILQMEWQKLSFSGKAVEFTGKKTDNIIRIEELQNIFSEYQLSDNEMKEIYAYAVQFLMKEVLFVSVQEIMERPQRYLNGEELDSIFTQAVIMPEITDFTEFLIQKYGLEKVLDLAKKRYDKLIWKEKFGEEIHDTEGDYAKKSENRKFSPVFSNKEFINDLDNLLRLYNKMTKPTLFRK